MSNGITIKVLGDFGPFSRIGKSIGYQVFHGNLSYLIDCGAPLFQEIGGHGLKIVDALIVTHCHDDHKRWFTDLALFHRYAQDVGERLTLVTSEDIRDELMKASAPALDRSLSQDSKRIVDIPYEEYIDYRVLGPRAKYRIVSRHEGAGRTVLCITDANGSLVGPDVAKIVISAKTGRQRMLFRDPHYGEWVEPESFYPFSSTTFYEEDRNIYHSSEGLTVEAVKAPVWHGVPAIGLKLRSEKERVFFTSDTIHNKNLWEHLAKEKRAQTLKGMSRREFESAGVLVGDINDYIERTWSEERYREAIEAFDDVVVIHDVAMCNSIVHTDYERLGETVLRPERTILTHSPDRIVSEWVLCDIGKTIKIEGDKFAEVVGRDLYPMDADIYLKDVGKYYVGYKSDQGRYGVYQKDGLLSISSDEKENAGSLLYKVDLYEDLGGRYFPKEENGDSWYFMRKDGKVERVEAGDDGSRGKVVDDQRVNLQRRPNRGSRSRI
ncbi:MAG: hypothetical protein P8Y66_03735 [Nitrospirota bacterium]|jgi:ribonuclease BN (tRNA processing enzyme)